MRALAALFALALAACSGPDETSAPAADDVAPTVAAAAPATLDLSGEWRVAEVVASPPDPGTPVIRVSITADTFRAQSQCKHYWWTYQMAGNAFDAKEAPYPDAMCERTDSYWEQFFVEAIERADKVIHQGDGSVLVTGPGGQVLLRPA